MAAAALHCTKPPPTSHPQPHFGRYYTCEVLLSFQYEHGVLEHDDDLKDWAISDRFGTSAISRRVSALSMHISQPSDRQVRESGKQPEMPRTCRLRSAVDRTIISCHLALNFGDDCSMTTMSTRKMKRIIFVPQKTGRQLSPQRQLMPSKLILQMENPRLEGAAARVPSSQIKPLRRKLYPNTCVLSQSSHFMPSLTTTSPGRHCRLIDRSNRRSWCSSQPC
jgi:hypothetical protein